MTVDIPYQSTEANHWVITDGAAGNRRQAEALAAALGLAATPASIRLRPPWSTLAPRCILRLDLGLDGPGVDRLLQSAPRLVIGCGRRAAAVTRWLRQRGRGACQAIQILDPGIDPRHWDLVIAPAHDGLQAPNVLCPLGSLHPVDSAWLAEGRDAWPGLSRLPGPRTAVLLGGPRRGVDIDADSLQAMFARLAQQLQTLGGGVMLICSRRTPPAWQAMAAVFAARHGGLCWCGPADGPNPYQGVLGWADRLVVTPDSVNMLSEACATGRPVHCLMPATALPPRLATFVQALQARDLLRAWDDARAPAAWRELPELAAEVRRRLARPVTTE